MLTSVSVSTFANRVEPITPILPAESINKGQAELGKKLFFDPRLSKSGFISCNSCHNLSMGGTDNLKTSIGDQWQQGPINSPTVLNASLNLAQFWDGRAADLKAQAGGPIANPKEMASTHTLAVSVINSIPEYVAEFNRVFNSNLVDIDKVTTAIAEFEKTLKTPDSRFDLWLKGDDSAITATELAGYELFKDSGCVACHNGEAVGSNSFQKMGIVKPYNANDGIEGLSAVTGNEADKYKFKVPTLRNIELTYPYFHDGGAATLKDAVMIMGDIQLGRQFSDTDAEKIVAFLKTLTGKQPQFPLPQLPPSNPLTPKAQPFAD